MSALPVIALGATLPAAGLVVLVLWLAGFARVERPLVLAALVWGATVAPFVAVHVNARLLAHLPTLTPVLLAPAVEELAKAAGLVLLLLWRPAGVGGARGGALYGALVGLGFTVTENLDYLVLAAIQGGSPGLQRAIWARGIVGGAKHAIFTAIAGAALAGARELPTRTGRIGLAAGGVALAVLQHALWNGVASRSITDALCHAARPDGPCLAVPDPFDLFVRVPVLTLTGLAPGVILLALLVRRLPRTS
jgi:RsiW-degrading membrane proteinase PrsW (M82 family)